MVNPEKEAAVAELTESFRESNGAVLTEYRGLTVKQLQDLRRALGESATYAVAKNTLTKLAAKQADVELPAELLTGPTAIAFITGDVVEAAKGLRDFAKDNKTLVIKGGFLDGKVLAPDEIRKLADLESREVLLAKLAGGMKASIAGAAGLFNAPLAQTARLLAALQAKAEADPSVLAAGAPVEAPAETAAEEAPAEQPAAESVPEAAPADAEAVSDSAPADAEAGTPASDEPVADTETATDDAGSEG